MVDYAKVIFKEIYTNHGLTNYKHDGTAKPMLLFVSYCHCYDNGKVHIKINGLHNPLPFKEVVVESASIPLDIWLRNNGWEKIGTETIEL